MELLHPVEKQQRIEVVDALRGLALLGILLANVPYAENFAAANPYAQTDKTLNFLFHLLIDKKFITIFSMLFGFGFYIQQKRAEASAVSFRPYYFRRMLILLVIGCIHGYVFWFGDIIRDYALCGMGLLLLYKWPSKRIILTAILFSVVLTATVFIANAALGLQEYSYDTSIANEFPVAESYRRYVWINARIDPFVNFIQDSPLTLVFSFGNMLLGYWLGKNEFFTLPAKFRSARIKLIIAGILLGFSASYLFVQVTSGKLELTPLLIWMPYLIVGGMLLQSLFYVSAFVSLYQTNWGRKILSLFVPVGKMSLTNYLIQTVLYLLVFYHWTNGFQLYGKVSLTETYLIALVFFALQVIFSRLWLKMHDQGPVEAAWKNLSYKRMFR